MSKKILITAGPTREMFDPVRYLSNLSTGEMGYAIAKEAVKKGYKVTLISGPTSLKIPNKVKFVAITSALELQKACRKHFKESDVLVMTAAVCDYVPVQKSVSKIRREGSKKLMLRQTPDIVAGLARKKGKRKVVGFCLETKDWINQGIRKCQKKGLDGIVANYITASYSPFGAKKVRTAFVDSAGHVQKLPHLSKPQIAKRLLTWLNKGS